MNANSKIISASEPYSHYFFPKLKEIEVIGSILFILVTEALSYLETVGVVSSLISRWDEGRAMREWSGLVFCLHMALSFFVMLAKSN